MQKRWGGLGVGMRILLHNMSEIIIIFKRKLLKKNIMVFSPYIRSSTHCILQADKSLEPLPIILSEISHCKITEYKIKKGQ